MLRSAASQFLSAARQAVRTNIVRASSHEPTEVTHAPFGDTKTVTPSNVGVTGPDARFPGEVVYHEDYPDCKGKKYPGEAWSDGETRVVWDKLPPVWAPNPTILPQPLKETDDEFDQRYINYFNRPDIDGWELRNALLSLHHEDVVAEPKITIAAFHAMRRLNEFPLTVRWLECLMYKCGPNKKKIWPWMMQELGPTLKELGIPTLEEIGYDKPELWYESPYDM